MAIQNFIPTIWSENLYRALDKKYIAVKNCNREYEGEIKDCGSTVRIAGVGPVTVSEYTKNGEIAAPQLLSDTVRNLTVNQAKCFNFMIDDIDRAQSLPHLMDEAMKNAASALADEADMYVYNLIRLEEAKLEYVKNDSFSILDALIEARTLLAQNNVTDPSDIVFEVSPAMAALILKEKLDLATDNGDILEHGCIGKLLGIPVFISNNIDDPTEDGEFYHCCARTKRAVAFAEQISEVEAYRPEKRFADAVKGLHLYGCRVLYPEELVHILISTT